MIRHNRPIEPKHYVVSNIFSYLRKSPVSFDLRRGVNANNRELIVLCLHISAHKDHEIRLRILCRNEPFQVYHVPNRKQVDA